MYSECKALTLTLWRLLLDDNDDNRIIVAWKFSSVCLVLHIFIFMLVFISVHWPLDFLFPQLHSVIKCSIILDIILFTIILTCSKYSNLIMLYLCWQNWGHWVFCFIQTGLKKNARNRTRENFVRGSDLALAPRWRTNKDNSNNNKIIIILLLLWSIQPRAVHPLLNAKPSAISSSRFLLLMKSVYNDNNNNNDKLTY